MASTALSPSPQPILGQSVRQLILGLIMPGQQAAQFLAVGRLSQPDQRSYFQLADPLLGEPEAFGDLGLAVRNISIQTIMHLDDLRLHFGQPLDQRRQALPDILPIPQPGRVRTTLGKV